MPETIPLAYQRPSVESQLERARDFLSRMQRRRSVRDFSDDPIPPGLLDLCIQAAGTAPSGAHKQPWRFVIVTDPQLKKQIREAAEHEEREFYRHRAAPEWLADLAPLGTDWSKPFLETAPALVVLFQVDFEPGPDGPRKHYYVTQSVGIAAGMFITAVHEAGLVTLTHTPSPMTFLGRVLRRPPHERPFLLLPVGYPAPGARVPDLHRKPLSEIRTLGIERPQGGGGNPAEGD